MLYESSILYELDRAYDATTFDFPAYDSDVLYESSATYDDAAREDEAASGVAPRNLKFLPIRDAEALPLRVGAEFGYHLRVAPSGDAAPFLALAGGAMFGIQSKAPDANGFAAYRRPSGMIAGAHQVRPEADACIDAEGLLASVGAAGGVRQVSPTGEAAAYGVAGRAFGGVGAVFPTGVRNPTDDEMIAMYQMARRGRLTGGQTGCIRRV